MTIAMVEKPLCRFTGYTLPHAALLTGVEPVLALWKLLMKS